MGAKVFKSGCRVDLNQTSLEELECLGVDTAAVQYRPVAELAPYYLDFSQLLESYPIYSLDLAIESGLLFSAEDRVVFIEGDGYLAVLKEANKNITSHVMAVLEENWNVVTSIKLSERYEVYSPLYLYQTYNLFNGDVDSGKWGFFDSKWKDAEVSWRGAVDKREFLYRQGDTFIVLSPCQDVMYLYLVTEDINTNNYSEFSPNSPYWKKVASSDTGFNICLGYKRKKHPQDLYNIIQLGSRSDFVEAPRRYEVPTPIYNDSV